MAASEDEHLTAAGAEAAILRDIEEAITRSDDDDLKMTSREITNADADMIYKESDVNDQTLSSENYVLYSQELMCLWTKFAQQTLKKALRKFHFLSRFCLFTNYSVGRLRNRASIFKARIAS